MTLRGVVWLLLALAVLGLAVELARESPSPGPLAAAHAELPELAGLAGCQRCHADGGLAEGCATCHAEIGAQLASATGWHGARLDQGVRECDRCHGEHWGTGFPLVHDGAWGGAPPTFASAHAHAPFTLAGAHTSLACVKCHRPQDGRTSFLGGSQTCDACHDDPHGAAMSDDCAACHAQEAFTPAARFEHAQRFPLLGPHAQAACADCHPATAARDYAAVRGTRCEECHASPHRAPLPGRCEECHHAIDPRWDAAAPRLTAAAHATTGFALAAPHAGLACAQCHREASFVARFPGRAASDCVACHESPHGGQFGARERDCASCHDDSFARCRTTAATHLPPLTGAHLTTACDRCHRPTTTDPAFVRFVATPSACTACHADPHGGQFAARDPSCEACHDTGCFKPSRYDFATRHVPLAGAHAAVECARCHFAPSAGAPVRFAATPTECGACHADPHGGQFRTVAGGCSACHDQRRFAPSLVTASRHQPPLEGAHLATACNRCHVADASGRVRFVGTARDCKSCHADTHAGQLTRRGNDCNQCHRSNERWLPVNFDHQRDSRFALDGVHARLDCVACHLQTQLPDGRTVVHYVPLGVECRDCHTGR